jgi:diacylglycerol kinase family enzyme
MTIPGMGIGAAASAAWAASEKKTNPADTHAKVVYFIARSTRQATMRACAVRDKMAERRWRARALFSSHGSK